MRRVIPRLLVACFTFALGLSLTPLGLELRSPPSPDSEGIQIHRSQSCDPALSLAPGADSSAAAALPIIPYYELMRNSVCYDGKIVRVGARIFWLENNMFFSAGGGYSQPEGPPAVQLNLANAEGVYAIMMRTCGPQCYEPLDVVVVGRFERFRPSVVMPPRGSFEVMSFESAARVR